MKTWAFPGTGAGILYGARRTFLKPSFLCSEKMHTKLLSGRSLIHSTIPKSLLWVGNCAQCHVCNGERKRERKRERRGRGARGTWAITEQIRAGIGYDQGCYVTRKTQLQGKDNLISSYSKTRSVASVFVHLRCYKQYPSTTGGAGRFVPASLGL